jgi:hypothetical protein
MTEREWLECTDSVKMLDHLFGRTRDRKSRLFAVACCRRIWDLIDSELYRRAVEVAERFADSPGNIIEWEESGGWVFRGLRRSAKGMPGTEEWEAVLRDVDNERNSLDEGAYSYRYDYATPEDTATWTLYLRYDLPVFVANSAAWLRSAPSPFWKSHERLEYADADSDWLARQQEEKAAQSHLIRDIFGNPFRPVSLDPSWTTTVVKTLAQDIYDERAFDHLPILADALEEAGCTSPEILSHCRQPGEHVRGCWVVDLVLDRGETEDFTRYGKTPP